MPAGSTTSSGRCCLEAASSLTLSLSWLLTTVPLAVWQHPFVDVFRYCNLKQWPQGNFTKEGNVKVAMVCLSVRLTGLLCLNPYAV